MIEKINHNVLHAIRLIEEAGFECYIVGGAVRDSLLDKEPHDYDLASNASFDELNIIFKDYKRDIYSKGITMSVVLNHTHFEITPYKGIDIIEDLSKRDFTINAIAYNINKGFVDPYCGIKDLSSRRLITVNNQNEVFDYDPLRILRGIRFSCVLGLSVDDKLKKAMNDNAYKLKTIAKERFQHELNPILKSIEPSKYIKDYFEVFKVLFPALSACYKFDQCNPKWHHLDVFEHTMLVLDSTKPNLELRLAALFHDIGKPLVFTKDEHGVGHFYNHEAISSEIARKNLLDLKYNSLTINIVCHMIEYHDRSLSKKEANIMKFLYDFGTNDLDLYFGLRRADIMGQNPELLDRIYEIDEITEIIRNILKEDKIITYKNLKINGRDLFDLGFEGTQIGKALDILLKLVISKKIKNQHDELIEYALKLKAEAPQ